MPVSPTRKRGRQCKHAGNNVTLNLYLSPRRTRSSDEDDFRHMKHSGTQTPDSDDISKRELESQLRNVKEQLKSARIHIEFLSKRMKTYRYRWIENYYRADNLERHMPDGVVVPDLDQIPESAASPGSFTELSENSTDP
ncbi:hypothetical protein BD769DRAFT_1670840 [Suillus cothurnatus]|nr:hypothetical protein BD769DRAFT_1670840 [Suillus cothurnatus]